jgi:hypothetical protein
MQGIRRNSGAGLYAVSFSKDAAAIPDANNAQK